MIWCTVCGVTKRGRVESTSIIGPFSDVVELEQAVDAVSDEIVEQGLLAAYTAFELCSDDVPELVV